MGNDRCGGGCGFFFFFNDTATTEIYTLSLHDALPICLDSLVCTCLRKRFLLRLPVLAPPKTFKYALGPWFNIVYLISDYKAKMLYEIFPFTLKYLDLLSEHVRLCVQDPVNAYIKIMGFLR